MSGLYRSISDPQPQTVPVPVIVGNFAVVVILDPGNYQCWASAVTVDETEGSWTLPQAGSYHVIISRLAGPTRSVTIIPGTGSAACAVDTAGVVEITLVAADNNALVVVS